MEKLKGSGVCCFSGGESVDQKGSCGQGFNPVGGWHECMNEKRADSVIQSMKHAFRLPILWGGVRAGEASANAMMSKKVEIFSLTNSVLLSAYIVLTRR